MDIVGHQKISFIDYPHKICSVLFIGGCNFRCPYCHNGHIVQSQVPKLKIEEIFAFLQKKRKYLDGVCISGGEPTLYDELYRLIRSLKMDGFLIKLDTNGSNPKMLQRLINENMIDYIAMDIKAPLNRYNLVSGVNVNTNDIQESVGLIQNFHGQYEFRTTVCKEILNREDIIQIAQWLKGSKQYYLQNFHDRDTVLKGKGQLKPYEKETLAEIMKEIEDYFEICRLRV